MPIGATIAVRATITIATSHEAIGSRGALTLDRPTVGAGEEDVASAATGEAHEIVSVDVDRAGLVARTCVALDRIAGDRAVVGVALRARSGEVAAARGSMERRLKTENMEVCSRRKGRKEIVTRARAPKS